MKRSEINEGLCRLGFVYATEIVLPDGSVSVQVDNNLLPQAGIDHIAGLLRGTGSLISNWHVGVYEGDFVPTSATTAADLPTNAQESVAYSEAARPLWDETYDGVQLITNFDNPAVFTFTADKRLYGGFLISDSNKGNNAGVLLSIARFSTPRDVPAGSEFRVRISISLVSAG